jgi:hypothetical protein
MVTQTINAIGLARAEMNSELRINFAYGCRVTQMNGGRAFRDRQNWRAASLFAEVKRAPTSVVPIIALRLGDRSARFEIGSVAKPCFMHIRHTVALFCFFFVSTLKQQTPNPAEP